MNIIYQEKIGDVEASLYLEKLGYTYKIKTRLKGSKRLETVGRSFVWFTDKNTAKAKMHTDLLTITKQLELFNIKD